MCWIRSLSIYVHSYHYRSITHVYSIIRIFMSSDRNRNALVHVQHPPSTSPCIRFVSFRLPDGGDQPPCSRGHIVNRQTMALATASSPNVTIRFCILCCRATASAPIKSSHLTVLLIHQNKVADPGKCVCSSVQVGIIAHPDSSGPTVCSVVVFGCAPDALFQSFI